MDRLPHARTQFTCEGFDSFISPHPWFEFDVDIAEKGGIKYGVVAIDNYTNYAWVHPMKENVKS